MSTDLHIGLSREQLQKILDGEEIGRRPYYHTHLKFKPYSKKRYQGDIRAWIFLLSDEEVENERSHNKHCDPFDFNKGTW